MHLRFGTSGYSYKEWKGPFYPEDLPAAKMLSFYAERFPAVEINSTYYQLPRRPVLANWSEQVPNDFSFTFKAPQRITHQKRLKDAAELTAHLFDTLSSLEARLGAVLFGLPPNLKKDVGRLEAFLDELPAQSRVAFEFRHPSWLEDDVFETLRSRGAALAIADSEERSCPFVATTGWGYLRLRRAGYGSAELAAWAERVRSTEWTEAFVFFKHEDEGAAPRLASAFARAFANSPSDAR